MCCCGVLSPPCQRGQWNVFIHLQMELGSELGDLFHWIWTLDKVLGLPACSCMFYVWWLALASHLHWTPLGLLDYYRMKLSLSQAFLLSGTLQKSRLILHNLAFHEKFYCHHRRLALLLLCGGYRLPDGCLLVWNLGGELWNSDSAEEFGLRVFSSL